MTCTTVCYAFVRYAFVALGLSLMVGCHLTGTDPATDGGTGTDATSEASTPAEAGTGSIACYIDSQMVCEEHPSPMGDEEANLKVVCSSASGLFSKPAACPAAGFVGKCTVVEASVTTVRRYYTGVDVAYNQDFCVNTAHGLWSTAF